MALLDPLTSDATLVARALADEPAAFEDLIARYQRQAHAIAHATGVPASSVDDVVQESFLQAFRGLRELRAPESFGPWLLSIVRNLSLKEIEVSRRTFDPARLMPAPASDPGAGATDLAEVREHIWDEVSRLPEGIREAIFLYYHEGESVRRVARALEISTPAVKSRLQRGRDLLRENLWRALGESLREMLPSAREWRQKGRKLSLFLSALVLPETKSSAMEVGAIEGASGFLRFAGTGVLIMNAKKLFCGAALAALLVTGWIGIVGTRVHGPPEEARVVTDAGKAATGSASADPLPGVEPGASVPQAARRVTSISGTVFREESAVPVPGARVAAIFDGERKHESVATTGEDGAYLLASLKPGKYRLWAWREDWTMRSPWSGNHEVEVREGEAVEGKDLSLVPGVIVEGRVVEEGTEMPIPGAAVNFQGLQFAASDAEGRFRLEGVAEGLLRISARARGYAKRRIELDASHGETPSITIELQPGGTIEGTVMDLTGVPAPGVEVTAQTASTHDSCKTDAAGRYAIDGIPLNAREVELTASRGGCFAAHAAITGFPSGEDRVTQDLRLEKGFAFRGRILDGSGQPIEGAELHILGSMAFATLRSDGEGRFAIEGGSERMFTLSAVKKGFAPASLGLRDLPPEGRETIELVLKPGHLVEGTVVDSRGPVEGAFVYVELENRAGPTPSTRTDARGRFRIDDLPEELSEIGALKEGYADLRWIPVKTDQRDMRLILEEAGQVEGIVSDRKTGAPVRPFVVKVSFAEGAFREKNQAKGFGGGLDASLGDEGLPFDFPDGRFRIRNGLAPGIFYRLLVVAPGYGETVLDGVEAWGRSTSREPVRIELEKGRELRGRVLAAATGEAVAGVRVSHVAHRPGRGQQLWRGSDRGEDSPVRVAVTDAEGGFVLEGLSETPGILLLEKPGFARTAVFRAAPSLEVQVHEIQPEAVLEGTCRSAAGEPLAGAGIDVTVDEMPFPGVWTDARGFYRIGGLPAGTAGVVMRHHGSLEKHRAVTLVAGEVTVVEFTQQDGAIRGRVTDGGRPSPKARVLLKSLASPREQQWIFADGEGRFRAGGLDPGSYELKSSRGGGISSFDGVSLKVEVGSGEVQCEISLTPAGGLSGRVLDRLTGSPVPGATLTLFKHHPAFFSAGGFKFPGSDWAPSGGSKAEGEEARFRLEVSSAGTYMVTARDGGNTAQGWLGPIDLEAGAQKEDLALQVGGPGSLAVTVRDAATRAPVESCDIVLTPAEGYPAWLHAKTDGSGVALLTSAPAGKYRLEARSESHLSFFEDVALGEAPVAREVSLSLASWIAVDLRGAADSPRPYNVKATLLSGGDPAWPYTSLEGKSLATGSTAAAGPPEPKVRLKTRSGHYTIRFEVSSPYMNSPIVLAQDLDVDVPEGGEAPVVLVLPEK